MIKKKNNEKKRSRNRKDVERGKRYEMRYEIRYENGIAVSDDCIDRF